MWNGKTVSVVFPAYNEEANIASAVADFRSLGWIDEVLVVDNRSTDRTAALAAEAGGHVVREEVPGFGSALRRGLAEAKGELIVLCEPDGTFVARDMVKFMAYAGDFDMVCGTRTTKELIWQGANMGWFLRAGNVAVAKLLQLLHGGPSLSDCGCTYRLVTREGFARIRNDLTVTGSHFLPEMLIAALKSRLRVIEIPVNYGRRVGVSKITGSWKGTLTTGCRMIGTILARRVGS